MSNIIELGSGKFVIDSGTIDGKAALFIEPAPAPGVVGERAEDGVIPKKTLVEGGFAITFDNHGSLAVLVDELQTIQSKMPASDSADGR